ncbi:hypothetical protein V8E54_011094 [Elaphomyces granulatus]
MSSSSRTTAYKQDARDIIKGRIPDLRLSTQKTLSNAIHDIEILVPMRFWNTFEMEARTRVYNRTYKPVPLDFNPAGGRRPSHIRSEHVLCADEEGVQGRFNTNISNVMIAIWHSEGIPLDFSSGRSTSTNCHGIPDVVIIPANGSEAMIVGELKIPDARPANKHRLIEQNIWLT